jgi:hypothetical protein
MSKEEQIVNRSGVDLIKPINKIKKKHKNKIDYGKIRTIKK